MGYPHRAGAAPPWLRRGRLLLRTAGAGWDKPSPPGPPPPESWRPGSGKGHEPLTGRRRRPVEPEVGAGAGVLPGELRGLGVQPAPPLRLELPPVAREPAGEPQVRRRLDPDAQRRPAVQRPWAAAA